MEPPHAYWAEHDHSDEHLNLLFTTHRHQATEPSRPDRADNHDHDHSDEHLNLLITTHRHQATEPSRPDRADNHDHDHSDEHLNLMYATVRQQDSFYPPCPSLPSFSPLYSGYVSPSLSRRRVSIRATGKTTLRVVNTTPPPTPQLTPLLSGENQRSEGEREMELSSGWSASSEASTVRVGGEKKAVRNRSPLLLLERGGTNIWARGLRKARKCIGNAVLAVEEKVDQIGELAGVGVGLERVKRRLFGKDRPVILKKAKVRFPLD